MLRLLSPCSLPPPSQLPLPPPPPPQHIHMFTCPSFPKAHTLLPGSVHIVQSASHSDQGPVSQKILSPLVILSMEKKMVTKVIREVKSISRLKILPDTGPR